jgi:hypothetical protein
MHLEPYHRPGTSNTCLPSTTWHHESGTLEGTPVPNRHSRPAGASIYELHSRDPRKPLDLLASYRGGSEGMWLIQARGWRWRFCGSLAVCDVMNWINRCDS